MTTMQHSLAKPAEGGASRQGFTSGGRAITVEWFEAAGAAATAPAVLMLHGADGLGSNHQYRAGARHVAAAGFHVALVHYLDRTDERRASFMTMFRNFAPWMETLHDAITWVAAKPEVDGSRIGVIGISLGGALALATAADDRRIKAIVDYFAPLPQSVADRAARLPPTLVLHGARDPIVPVANAHALEKLLKAQGTPHEVAVYPDQGHGFRGEANADAGRRAVSFLRRHLGGAPVPS